MTLPTTYSAALLLTVLTMLCWGSWANTFKLTGKLTKQWRFELFYYDYSMGVFLLALVAALTLGSSGFDGLPFFDNLMDSGHKRWAFGLAGGVVFNLANMLLVAAISVAGLAVAFPVGIGLALVVGVIWNYALNPQANPLLLFGGVALVMGAIVLDAMAYAAHARSRPAVEGAKPKGIGKGIVLSLICGVLMGSFYPLVQMGTTGENGLGPYAVGFLFSIGVLLSTVVFNLFFLNFPVEGPPVEMRDYFRGSLKDHALGIAGGAVWCLGTIANFAAASTPKEVQVGPAVSYAIGQGATMVSALWGLLVWKEFAGANARVKTLLALMLLLFAIGLAMISVAPLYSHS